MEFVELLIDTFEKQIDSVRYAEHFTFLASELYFLKNTMIMNIIDDFTSESNTVF